MLALSSKVVLSFIGLFASLQSGVSGKYMPKSLIRQKQLLAAQHHQDYPVFAATPGSNERTGAKLTFKNIKAKQFLVDGRRIPEVDFDVGPSYAGLLPISAAANETRKLFFWFFPPGPQGSVDDLIFWTNGGPGCSSLEGLLQENGPFSWGYGQAKPTKNEFSWTNLSSVLYLEQPVGTGFSQGTPTAKDENDIAAQVVGFLQQFLEIFSELKGKKFYLTGESYAGTYIPYIANYIYENPKKLALNLQGTWISDPSISHDVVGSQIPAVDFVHKFENVFALNKTFMAFIDQKAADCGYKGYIEKYVTFPPKGPLPVPNGKTTPDDECDVWDMIFSAVLLTNPAFNMYRIFDTYPILWDVLGFPGSFPQQQSPIYFDRADVKAAIHAPNVKWSTCAEKPVFVNAEDHDVDNSLPPAFTVLPNVIQKSNKTVIVHGLADFVLMADGTRIAIQNMTWFGKQGFQQPIQADSLIVDGVGALGTAHSERGLTFVEIQLAGHMTPQFSPKAVFQTMQFLMGFRSSL
jgi:carboxypeptidase D